MRIENEKDKLIELVYKKRTGAGLSIRKLAEITGVSFATLSRLERSQGAPDDNTTIRLVNWLGDEAKHLDLPAAHVTEVHFLAAKNIDTKTIEALSAIASTLKARHCV